jgi:hypothetical protein
MAKPLVIAKREGPDWLITYQIDGLDEQDTLMVVGSPTIDDALREARLSLDATKQGWYTITRAELVSTSGTEE